MTNTYDNTICAEMDGGERLKKMIAYYEHLRDYEHRAECFIVEDGDGHEFVVGSELLSCGQPDCPFKVPVVT